MKIVGYFILALLGVASIGVVGSYIGTLANVATAPAKVINKTVDADNIIQSYEWFFDVNAAFNARLSQVRQYSDFFNEESDPSEKRKLRIEMSAMQQTCRELAEKYNANSEKMNKSIFKGWDLPDTLNQFTCK